MGVQLLAALCPSTVIAVDTRPAALEMARTAGAAHTVVSGPDAAAEIVELTAGRGAELVLDFVGVDASMQLAAASSRQLGHITVVGIGGGTYPFGFFTLPYEASLSTTYWGSVPELIEVLALAERGLIHAQVEQVPLSGAADAYGRLAAGQLEGRVVVVPD
jgi:propanol-preferring alcohol dehydrogenase